MLHLGMVHQILYHLLGVLGMALQPQGQGFGALKQQERGEGRDGCAGIPEQDCADVSSKSSGTRSLGELHAVIAGVGLRDPGIFAGYLPVEGAAVDDYTADGSTVATDKLGSGMNNDICAVLDRADQVRSCEGRVNYQRQAVLVSDRCQFFQICDV